MQIFYMYFLHFLNFPRIKLLFPVIWSVIVSSMCYLRLVNKDLLCLLIEDMDLA